MLFDRSTRKSASKKIIEELPFPHPPRCAATPHNAINFGDKAIVTLTSGKGVLIGELRDYQAHSALLQIKPADEEGARPIHLEQIKRLQVTKFLQWTPAPLPKLLEDFDDTAPDMQQFTIEFIDGDILEGRTLGFHEDKHGLHLFPAQENLNYFYTFIPHNAIRQHQIGKPLGELLVENGALTPLQVEDALSSQKQARHRPLGEWLKSNAIVTANDLKEALSRQALTPNVRLGEVLVSTGAITPEQLQAALEFQKQNRQMKMGDILVHQGLVTRKQIQHSLAQKFGIPLVDLKKIEIDYAAAKLIPEDLARKHRALPILTYDKRLVVALEDPMNRDALEDIRFACQLTVEPVMSSVENIEEFIDRVYLALNTDEIISYDFTPTDHTSNEYELEPDVDVIDNAAISDNKIVRLANQIIMDAYVQGVSDIHLEPYGRDKAMLIRYRRDGSLLPAKEVPPHMRAPLIARFKIMANLDIAERRKPQDGKIDFKRYGPLKIELRVATVPTAGGEEDMVMRILRAGEPLPLDSLGLTAYNQSVLLDLIHKPYGLFFVCGPTGSGKTTTLHSILAHLNTPDTKIWTIEDPVEITQRGLRQVQVAPKIGLTFAAAMRAFLRADPDIIMVGEMRDLETTKMGIEASLTGHLVLSTLHTNSAPESIVRLLDLGMDPFNFADALLGILAQRLAKRLCMRCKESYTPNAAEIEELLTEYCWELTASAGVPWDDPATRTPVMNDWLQRYAGPAGTFTLYRPKGCEQCEQTGYYGRLGLHELMAATDGIKHLIQKRKPVTELNREAIRNGMRTLKQDGIEKVLQGLTDFVQIKKVCIK